MTLRKGDDPGLVLDERHHTAAVFGVLVAHAGPGLPYKVVDEAAARVFAALEQTGLPPREIHGRPAELVLDSVLEIEGPPAS